MKTIIHTLLLPFAFTMITLSALAHDVIPPEHYLNEFYIYNVEEEVVLEWFTLQEVDVKYFIIERATGHSKFFKEIGKIKAQDSKEDVMYLFSDEKPELHNKYRIKIILKNGYVQTSKILKAHGDPTQIGNSNTNEFRCKG